MVLDTPFTIADGRPEAYQSNRLPDSIRQESLQRAERNAPPRNDRLAVTPAVLPNLTIHNDSTPGPHNNANHLPRVETAPKPETPPHPPIPQPGEFNKKLAREALRQDKLMKGTGHCALAIQRALSRSGLPQFYGTGNGWDMIEPLEDSGLFVRIPESESAVGDLILRPPSQNRRRHSRYGDISVVTARHGDLIKQTNDATFEFKRDNPRYDGKAIFLRYNSGLHSRDFETEPRRAH
jgi:hypothetical protein